MHYNLLYDLGADPERKYVTDTNEIVRNSCEELFIAMSRGAAFNNDAFERWRSSVNDLIERKDGGWTYLDIQKMSIMSWDPSDIDWDIVIRDNLL